MRVYNTAKHDTTKVLTLTSIAQEYRNSKPDTCISIAEKALQMSEKIDFEKGKGLALGRIGMYYIQKDKYLEALAYLQKAVKIQEKIKDEKGLSITLDAIGNSYLKQSNYAKALEYLEKSLEISKKIKNISVTQVTLMRMGIAYNQQSNYPKAIEYYQKSLEYAKKIDNKIGIAHALGNMGIVYDNQNDTTKALEHYQRSMKISEEVGEQYGVGVSLNAIGVIYNKSKNYKKALEYYKKSLEIRKKIADKNGIGISLGNMAQAYKQQGNTNEALKYYKESLDIQTQIGDKRGSTYALNGIAQIYQKMKEYDKSIEYSKKALQIAQEIKTPFEIRNTSDGLYQTYKLKGDYGKALEYHELFKAMNDTLFNTEKSKAIANLESKAEIEGKQKEIAILNKNQEILKKDSFLMRVIIGFALLSIVGLTYFGYVVNRSRKRHKRTKEKVRQQNEEINQINEELQTTLTTVNEQKNEIEYKNQAIEDSIIYAQRIQKAILPLEDKFTEHLPAYFILFQPRDVVSGDFYYFEEKHDKLILASIDCTGHGVPGAFMTMIASEILNEIIQNKAIVAPDLILNELHKRIRTALKQTETQNRDGMDLVLLVIDKKAKEVSFAGAKNTLIYIQNNELHQIKGDKMPIGGEQKEMERVFTKHIIRIDTPTTFYMFTDGYQDQFGGKERKKFMIAQMKSIFQNIHQQDMNAQKQMLAQHINHWMAEGNEKQIDDILVLGIRI